MARLSLYNITVREVSVGTMGAHEVRCTVERSVDQAPTHTVCTVRGRSEEEVVREARRQVRMARHCGGL